jgi:hypothetical protein
MLLLYLGLFVFLSLASIIRMIGDDFADLLAIVWLLCLNFLIQPIDLFLELLDANLLETDLAFELLVSVEEILIPLDELFLFDP